MVICHGEVKKPFFRLQLILNPTNQTNNQLIDYEQIELNWETEIGLTWIWRPLLDASAPRSCSSFREQVGTNLQLFVSPVSLVSTWVWRLGWPAESWALEVPQHSPRLLTETRLCSTPWQTMASTLYSREREAFQTLIMIQASGLSKLTHRCLGSSCPCTLFLPMLVGPEQHTPHQGPGRLKTSEDSQDENVAWHSVFVFTWTVGAMSQRICQPLYINTVISTTPVVLLDGEDAVWDRYGMIQSGDSFWLCKAKF